MAINDISIAATAEKDSFLAFKDSDLSTDKASKALFLSQLQDADKSLMPETPSNANTQQSSIALEGAGDETHNQDEEKATHSELENSDVLTGDSVLAQINSSQALDVSVKKHGYIEVNTQPSKQALTPGAVMDSQGDKTTTSETVTDENAQRLNSAASDVSLIKNSSLKSTLVTSEVQLPVSGAANAKTISELPNNELKERTLADTGTSKTPIAQAVNAQLNTAVNAAESKADLAALGSETASQAQESLTVSDGEIEQLAKELSLTASDSKQSMAQTSLTTTSKLFSSLTDDQRAQLNLKIETLSNDGLTAKSNSGIDSIKQLLNKFAVQNEETATSEEPTIQLQLKTLSSTEKQALLNQLNNYVSAEQPSGKTLDKVNESIKDLQALIEAEPNQSKVLPAASNTSSILKAQQSNGSAMANSISSSVNSDAQSSVKLQSPQTSNVSIDDFDALNKELQQQSLAKESNSQAALPRVAQVFSLIMNGLNSTQEQINTQYDSLSYEQSIIEIQALQSQQLQTNSAQVKQVNIDASMMQAINIVKSDAAKMLQERVSSMLSISNKEAEIRLDPPEMGSMQIRIRSDAEQAQINFVVQNQQAKEALEQSMPRLREMLAEQGIDLGESSISYGQSSGDENEQNAEHSQEQMANKNTEQDKNDELVGANSQSSRQQTSSSIDYYA